MIKSLNEQPEKGFIQVIHEFNNKTVIRDYKIDFERSHFGDDEDPLTTIVINKDDYVDIEV